MTGGSITERLSYRLFFWAKVGRRGDRGERRAASLSTRGLKPAFSQGWEERCPCPKSCLLQPASLFQSMLFVGIFVAICLFFQAVKLTDNNPELTSAIPGMRYITLVKLSNLCFLTGQSWERSLTSPKAQLQTLGKITTCGQTQETTLTKRKKAIHGSFGVKLPDSENAATDQPITMNLESSFFKPLGA